MSDPDILYELGDFDYTKGQYVAHRVYDPNGILLEKQTTTNNLYLDDEVILNQMHILDKEEEEKERKEMKRAIHIFHIGFQRQHHLYNNYGASNTSSSVREIDDYTINFDEADAKALDCTHKIYGPVKFLALEVGSNYGNCCYRGLYLWTSKTSDGNFCITHVHPVKINEQMPIIFKSSNESPGPETESAETLGFKVFLSSSGVTQVVDHTFDDDPECELAETQVQVGDLYQIKSDIYCSKPSWIVKLVRCPSQILYSNEASAYAKVFPYISIETEGLSK